MLTKDDLEQIKKALLPLEDKISDLENSLEDNTSNLSMDIFKVRAELKEEANHIRRVLKEIRESQIL